MLRLRAIALAQKFVDAFEEESRELFFSGSVT